MDLTKRAPLLVSLVVLLVTVVVYFTTFYRTVPFWDSGEFIAVSYILGIPHPPGTPFYVLLGRIATLIPWGSIAERVNGLSAVAAALAVWLTYLTGLRLVRLVQGPEARRSDEWIEIVAAFSGALMLAFSDSFWENSIEAEVYSLMSLAQILVFWLGLRWWEAHEQKPTAGPLLVCVYVMWLCVGLHLGVGIMGLPLILLVWLVAAPIVQAQQRVRVVGGNLARVGNVPRISGNLLDAKVIPPMGVLGAEGTEGNRRALAVRTFGGGGGLLGAGRCPRRFSGHNHAAASRREDPRLESRPGRRTQARHGALRRHEGLDGASRRAPAHTAGRLDVRRGLAHARDFRRGEEGGCGPGGAFRPRRSRSPHPTISAFRRRAMALG